MADSPLYNCDQVQSVRRIIKECPETMFSGGIAGLHKRPEKATQFYHPNFWF